MYFLPASACFKVNFSYSFVFFTFCEELKANASASLFTSFTFAYIEKHLMPSHKD